jgi:hypothetical protein
MVTVEPPPDVDPRLSQFGPHVSPAASATACPISGIDPEGGEARPGVPFPRPKTPRIWSLEEAQRFLESSQRIADPLHAAYVLSLVLGLRRGEVLDLAWEDVDLDASEMPARCQRDAYPVANAAGRGPARPATHQDSQL